MSSAPFRALIVDDEPLARKRVARLLARHSDFVVLDSCGSGAEAIERIRVLNPDLVFLDVQMPDVDGLAIVSEIGAGQMPLIIFTTAYEKHALRAFDLHAVDYLLKPYAESRFDEALEEARRRLASGAASHPDNVAVTSGGVTKLVPVNDVDWFETDGNYVSVNAAGRRYLLRATITRMEQTLDPRRFARIHRRFIVNVERVMEVEPARGGDAVVRLKNGVRLRLSRSYREAFMSRMVR
jgi:two-component system LytT family response regulator